MARLLDRFRRRKPEQEVIDYEPQHDDDGFTLFGRKTGQQRGPIRGGYYAAQTGHENREGRRLYVRYVQPSRQVRKYIVGFGRWRRWPPRWHDGESWAAQTAVGDRPPRRARRANMIAIYRGRKRARGRRVTIPGR